MKNPILIVLIALVQAWACLVAHGQTVRYEFTGGSMAPTVTFYLPFIRDSQTTATDYVDIDNITLVFKSVPPPVQEITSLSATVILPLETALGWQESLPDETGFVIERSVTGSGVWETVITTAADVTSVRDLTMSPGGSCTYRISALLSGGGSSPWVLSNPVNVPAAAGGSTLVVMPIGDSITEGTDGIGGYRSPLNASWRILHFGSATASQPASASVRRFIRVRILKP